MSQLDDIESRLKVASPGAITITPTDIDYLLTLARKQAAALEAVRQATEEARNIARLQGRRTGIVSTYILLDALSEAAP